VRRVWIGLLASAAGGWLAWRLSGTFRAEVRGPSMGPALRAGDFVVATRSGRLRRGDVVVVRRPGSDLEVVKRLVGLPGERMRIEGPRVWVDGRTLDEPYAHGFGIGGTWTLGPGGYLVLGDDRSRSTDGRTFGPVGRDAIAGVVRLTYWPRPRWVVPARYEP
jgi:signal peptidase I